MDIDFIIPLNFQELASDQSDGYYVQRIYEPNQIDKKLGGKLCLIENTIMYA